MNTVECEAQSKAQSEAESGAQSAATFTVVITSWLVSAYDFYARVVKDYKRASERSERVSLAIFHNKCIIEIVAISEPTMK